MNDWLATVVMASALGMDVFSVSLSMGMQRPPWRQIGWIGMVFGFFHIVMPFVGMVTGGFFSKHIHILATALSGALLCLIGLHMVASSVQSSTTSLSKPLFGWGLFFVACSVSVDSLSAGLSLGMLGAEKMMTISTIGAVSTFFAWLGLLIGARLHRYIGAYGELLGGCILIGFGIQLLLP